MNTETWRPIPGFAPYEVSDQGRVRGARRKGSQGQVLSGTLNGRGYPAVKLYVDGAATTSTVHCLVLLAFVGPRPDDSPHVRHLDGDKRNNHVGNLRYGTISENALDTIAHGRNQNAAKTHCKAGHAFDTENTYVAPSSPTVRQCRRCTRIRQSAARKVAA